MKKTVWYNGTCCKYDSAGGNVHRIETVTPIGRVTSDLAVFDSLEGREEIIFSLV